MLSKALRQASIRSWSVMVAAYHRQVWRAMMSAANEDKELSEEFLILEKFL